MLQVPLVRQNRLVLGLVLLLRSLNLLLHVGEGIHHLTRHFPHSPSSRRRHGSQVTPLVSVPLLTDDDVDPMPPPEGEVVADAETEAFGGGLVDLSLLPLYPDHTTIHIWDGKIALVGFFIFYLNFNC